MPENNPESAAYDNAGLQMDAAPPPYHEIDGLNLAAPQPEDRPASEVINIEESIGKSSRGTSSTSLATGDTPYGACDEADPVRRRSPLTEEDAEEAPADQPDGFPTRALVKCRSTLSSVYTKHKGLIWSIFKILLLLAYHVYFAYAIYYAVEHGDGIDFCDGVGFLIIITGLVYLGVLNSYVGKLYRNVLKPLFRDVLKPSRPYQLLKKHVIRPLSPPLRRLYHNRWVRLGLGLLALGAVVLYLVLDSADERLRLVSAFGIATFIFICWLFSRHPGKVIWRHVIWGMSVQFVFGLIILRWDTGRDVFSCIGNKINSFLDFSKDGSEFVFGFLSSGDPFVFATSVLPVIFFFNFIIQILYYYGVMQVMIIKMGWLLQVTVGTTACESMNAAANVFLSMTTSPLLIKPYLPRLTMSELHAIMTGGFATIAGSVFAAYVGFGVSASHLLSASVMSAPAALAISKLVYPETERSRTTINDITIERGDEVNALDAASRGAMSVVKIVGYICASLIAFISFIALINGVLGWLGSLVGMPFPLTFEYLASLVFWPVAWLMGVPWTECGLIGELIGLKTVLNEFVAYLRLKKMIEAGLLSQRSIVIATYALCGFSNFGAMGITISGLSAMAPERRSDLARLALSAMMAGNVACFLTACVAGALISDPSSVTAAITTVAQNTTLAG